MHAEAPGPISIEADSREQENGQGGLDVVQITTTLRNSAEGSPFVSGDIPTCPLFLIELQVISSQPQQSPSHLGAFTMSDSQHVWLWRRMTPSLRQVRRVPPPHRARVTFPAMPDGAFPKLPRSSTGSRPGRGF